MNYKTMTDEEVKKTCHSCANLKFKTAFAKNKRTKDGLQTQCRSCVKAYRKRPESKTRESLRKSKWYRENREEVLLKRKIYRDGNSDRVNSNLKRWKESNREKVRASCKRWREANPEKARCHRLVNEAVNRGLLKKFSCHICGDQDSQAHHEDYSKPLEVVWLCNKHHKERHKELRSGNAKPVLEAFDKLNPSTV